jgi:arsenite oxidase large subunit
MTASHGLLETFQRMTTQNPHQIKSTDKKKVIETLKKRVDSDGMIVVHQEIYLREPLGTKFADIILPAASWGEEDFTRANGERRIRLYSKFYDPPGESKPDWWIVAQIAKRMGFPGFDWKDSNEIFEEAARFSRKKRTNYHPLVWLAKKQGKRGHELLREYGTEGIQAPIRYENGKLVGTKRLHDSTLKLGTPEGPTVHSKWLTAFNTQSGKANFIKSPWKLFSDFFDHIKPKDGEVWVINGRINEIWQSGFDDVERRPYITQRWPENFMEIHPDDAKILGIENGDYVVAESDRVPVQTGGFIARDTKDMLFSGLLRDGHIKFVKGRAKAVALITPAVRKGITFMYFLDPKEPANSLVSRVPDPISNNYRFKLGVGKVRKVGESPYKNSFAQMTFARRTIV